MQDSRGVELAVGQIIVWSGGYNHGRIPRVGEVIAINEEKHFLSGKAPKNTWNKYATGIANLNPDHVTVITGVPEV